MWCHFSFPPVFLQGDPQCSLQFQPTRAKIRCLALPCCSTSHLAGTGVLGVAPRGWHSCRNKISCSLISGVRVLLKAPLQLPTAPSMDGELGVSQSGCRGVGAAVALEGQYVCLCFLLAMSAQVLLLLPRKQIVGCAGCSCSSPDVSPCVPAIDG